MLTKQDITEVRERLGELVPYFEARGYRVFPLSAATGDGTRALVEAVGLELERLRREGAPEDPPELP